MPLTKPTKLPRFANVTAEVVEPTEGKKDNGWVPGEKPPAQHMNWLFSWIYAWCAWLNDLTNQALTWAAAHVFQRGITVTQATTNTKAVDATGNGSAAGVQGTGGSTSGTGVSGVGGASNGTGVSGVGGATNGMGGDFAGTGTGTGARGTGGVSSGFGLEGIGGATSGIGVQGTGVGGGVKGVGTSLASGVIGTGGSGNGKGGDFTGGGSGTGVAGTGGSTSGIGVNGIGGATNGIGVQGTGTGTGTGVKAAAGGTGFALDIGAGNAVITGTQPTVSANPGANNLLCATNICKAWAQVNLPLGVPSLLDGYNIASAVMSGTSTVVVTLVRPMANTTYAPGVTIAASNSGANIVPQFAVTIVSTTVFNITFYSSPTVVKDITPINLALFINVFGRQ